jgi:hypothetical protein
VIIQKKYVILIFLLAIVLCANAQYKKPIRLNEPDYDLGKRLRFGFSLGLNTMDFKIKNGNKATDTIADISHLTPGFSVNAICDFRLSENFHLRFLPGYSFGQRNLSFFNPDGSFLSKMTIESSFIELPVSIKYSVQRVNNVRPYLLLCENFRIDLASSKKNNDLNNNSGVLYRLSKGDVYYEIGFGTDFFLEFFKFSLELKYSVGMFNVLNRYPDNTDNYVKSIDKINSRLFIVSFHFE